MAAKAGRHDDQYMVRFPAGLRDRIKEAADANGRSMNSEIVARLEDSFVTDRLALVADESAIKPPTAKELQRLAEIIVILERNALDEKQEAKLDRDYEKAAAKPRVRKPGAK